MAENRFRVRKSKVEDILFDTTITPIDQVEGLMQWNETDGTLDLTLQGGTVTQQIGQELLVKCRNDSDALIANGTPVYISGRQGNRPKIFPARSDVHGTAYVFGVATENIADNSDGYVTTFGYVRQIKTDYSGTGDWGSTWQESDNLYVSKTISGQLTNVEPDPPHHSDVVGQVGVVGSAGVGSIFINIRHHTAIEELSDVNGTPLTTNGQLMVWNNSSGYFDFDYNINDFALTGDLSSYATIDYVTGISGDLQTTIDGLDASNHVPYNGATGDVDLGVHNIVATTGEFTNLDISSNIVVDGLVDGRDIAADGSTLNSLVAATGNYVLHSETGSAATLASGVLLDRANHTGTQTLSTISDAGTIASFNSGDYLNTARTATYTPTADYHPATKKYVDDNIITDHGGLAGLGDDDHTQYFTTGRADSRYSQLGHTHVVADISNSGLLLDRANHTGTQTASTISDFDTEVSNNTDVSANTSARHDAVTVTDSSEIDFTLVGQDITASLKTGSIDETKLDTSVNDSLDLADSSLQPADIGTIASFNSGDFVDVYNNQTINGEKTFASDIYAQSNAFVGTDLTITGNATIKGNADITGNIIVNSGYMQINGPQANDEIYLGPIPSVDAYAGIWFRKTQATATANNYSIVGDTNNTLLNAPTTTIFRINNSTKATLTASEFDFATQVDMNSGLNVTGDVNITGDLTLNNEPTQDKHAATKKYVDDHAAVAATTTTTGHVELATDAEAHAATDTTRAVTPSNLLIKKDGTAIVAGALDGDSRGSGALDVQAGRNSSSQVASGASSSAVGYDNRAFGDNSSAFGYYNNASAFKSSAFGYSNEASGDQSSAFGYNNTASGFYSSAFGYDNTASGNSSCSFGISNTASGAGSIAVGYSNTSSANYGSSCFGYFNTASGFAGAAIGLRNTASGLTRSSAFGYQNTASGDQANAFGYFNTASGNYSSAVGYQNTASAYRSSAVGYQNTASGNYSSAFGNSNTASGSGSSSVGKSNNTQGGNSSLFGNANREIGTATWLNNSLFGYDNEVTSSGSGLSIQNLTVVGYKNSWAQYASINGATAVGYQNKPQGNYSSLVGASNEEAGPSTASFTKNSLFGYDNVITAGSASGLSIENCTIVGYQNSWTQNSSLNGATAVGHINEASTNYSSAVGYDNTASGIESSAIGKSNTASSNYTCAIGYNNTASGNSGSTAVGYGNTASANYGSSAFGESNTASGFAGKAFGGYNTASGVASSAFGYVNTASSGYSSAFGKGNTASAYNTSAFGYANTASGSYSAAFGKNNTASGGSSSAFGIYNTASGGFGSSAFGFQNTASGYQVITVGFQNTASTINSAVFGRSNFVSTGDASVAIGILNNQTGGTINTTTGVISGTPAAAACGDLSTAVGISNKASGNTSSAFGYNNTASGNNSSALGKNNTASGATSFAVGYNNTASGNYIAAFGYSNTVSGNYAASAFGGFNTASGNYSSAFGHYNTSSGYSSTAFGFLNTASGNGSSAFGYRNTASGNYSSSVGRYVTTTIAHTFEAGYWSSPTIRVGAIRMHPNGQVAMTVEDSSSAPTDGGATAGSEADGTLPRGMVALRRDGTDLYVDANISGTINTVSLAKIISAYKTTNEDKTNDTTLADDTELSISLEADSIYIFEIIAPYWTLDGTTTQGINFGVSYPTGTTVEGHYDIAASANWQFIGRRFIQTTTRSYGGGNGGGEAQVRIKGTIDTAGTAGNFAFKWAQSASSANRTRVARGAYITATKIV
jgi:hypothetical protein